jgi:hypothetical protein
LIDHILIHAIIIKQIITKVIPLRIKPFQDSITSSGFYKKHYN